MERQDWYELWAEGGRGIIGLRAKKKNVSWKSGLHVGMLGYTTSVN